MTHRSLFLLSLLLLSTCTHSPTSDSANITFLNSAWSATPQSLSMDHILNIFRYQIGEATPSDLTNSAEYLK